jgi:hypothetical protein
MYDKICVCNFIRWKKALLLTVVVVLSVGTMLVAMYVLAIDSELQEIKIANAMRIIMCALSAYDEHQKHLPQAIYTNEHGCHLYSWRYTITPYLQCDWWMSDACRKAKWDDAVNRHMAGLAPSPYCISENSKRHRQTNIVAITGPGTAFDPSQQLRLADIPPNTILLIEMTSSGIHWMQPGDLYIAHVPHAITSGLDGKGVHVAFADGAIWFLNLDTPLDDLKKFVSGHGFREILVLRQSG